MRLRKWSIGTHGVSHCDPGGLTVGGRLDAGVEDAGEPDEESDDARGVHRGSVHSIVFSVQRSCHVVRGTKDLDQHV